MTRCGAHEFREAPHVRTPDIFIKGVGVHLPEQVAVDWAVQRGLYSAEEAEISQLTGTLVAGNLSAPEMALKAAQEAVERSGQEPAELNLLLYADVWHQGPEGWQPFSYLQHHLTGGHVPAMELRQGCAGMFGGMELAASYLRADPARTSALLVAADNFGTPGIDRWHSGPFIFGDAASAVVLSKDPGFARLLSVCTTTVLDEDELNRGGQPLFPPSITVGRQVAFRVRRPDVPRPPAVRARAAARNLRLHASFLGLVDQTLAEADISVADITRLAVVNTIREVVQDRGMDMIGVDFSKSTWDYGRSVGHCGASDQIMSFDRLLATGELKPGDHLMMLATGPGIVLSCAVIQVVEPPAWTS